MEKCAVPNCSNSTTTGIPFPKQEDLLEKWLKSLGIPDFVPTTSSFVCLDHFGSGELLDITDSVLENSLEELPIPEVTVDTKWGAFLDNNDEDCKGENLNSICRLCTSHADVSVDIFGKLDGIVTVSKAIAQCIPAIKITKTDLLSKLICTECLNMVKSFHKFRNSCIQMDIKQRNMLLNQAQKRKCTNQSAEGATKKFHPDPNNELVTSKEVAVDRKFQQVEAELMKALEGKLTDEMKSADNIIIEVQSDDENENSAEIDGIKQENVIKLGTNELRLPKGIMVNVSQAKVGIRNARVIKAMGNSEFCLADGYLFEFRLFKGNVRHLKCLNTKCRSIAQQTGIFDNKINVKVAHNHAPSSEDDRKKQMFLHLMRRKMQTDRTLNFRSVYEEFCVKDPQMKKLVPLKTVINQICCQQMTMKTPHIYSFEQFYELIENDEFHKLHFTYGGKQFYQEKLQTEDGFKAVIFANRDTIEQVSDSKIMYVDASFKIDTKECFQYHLVSVLVWVSDSYYPITFALVNEKSQEIYKAVFGYLHDVLAPKLRPDEIVTDYQAALYYSLAETYLNSHIGGSVFYYTQNLYKKICSLNLSRELETNSCFRNIYHMILMLPLLPVNTILDGLNNVELQAAEMGQSNLTRPIFDYVRSLWMNQVTPDLFCVHRLENRINENVIAPFKKLRDFLMLSKGKMQKQQITICSVVEKLIELENFLQAVYSAPSKKSFARDLSSSQKKNVIRAWQFIESHPKININNFFTKVLGYIKCMENQLWIWGFYRFAGYEDDDLINAANFSIVNSNEEDKNYLTYECGGDNEVVVDVVIDQKDGFLVHETELVEEGNRNNYTSQV